MSKKKDKDRTNLYIALAGMLAIFLVSVSGIVMLTNGLADYREQVVDLEEQNDMLNKQVWTVGLENGSLKADLNQCQVGYGQLYNYAVQLEQYVLNLQEDGNV